MNRTAKKMLVLAAVAAILLGLGMGSFMMYVAWEHNPQGEFHDSEGIHWVYWLTLGICWFIPTGLAVFLAFGALPALVIQSIAFIRKRIR